MKDNLITAALIILYIAFILWITHSPGCSSILLVAYLGFVLYVFVKEYDDVDGRKSFMNLAAGLFMFAIGGLLQGVKRWGYDVEKSGIGTVILVIWFIYQHNHPTVPNTPTQRPQMPATHVKLWVRVLFIIITFGVLWGLIRWLFW